MENISGVSFSILSFIYLMIISCFYFSKKRSNSIETKIYSILIIVTLIGLLIDIIGYFIFNKVGESTFITIIISKLYIIYYFSWIILFTSYIYIISFDIDNSNYKKVSKIFSIVFILGCLLFSVLQINISFNDKQIFTYGLAVNVQYFVSVLCIIFMIYCLIKNFRYLKIKKFLPLILFLIFGVIVMIIQGKYPHLLLLITAESIVTALMYFTIENPDMKMLEELEKNRKLIDRNTEEKSNLLFELSHEVREPLGKIKEISSNVSNIEDKEILKEKLIKINEKANDMSLLVNDILDISVTNRKNMQIYNETYDPTLLFKKLVIKFKEEKHENVKFNVSIPESLPKRLYGDSVKIKQIVNTVLTNAFKYTKEGYVDFKVMNINKYDIARLIIEVEDTGSGMSIDKINEVLNNTKEITEEEIKNIDKIDLGLKLANKLVIELGGILVIKSEENKGTKITIIIDEKIKEEGYNEIIEKGNYLKKEKVGIVGNNTKELNKIRDLITEYETKVYLDGNELIENIKNKEKFDCIILFDEMKPSGIEVLKKLKEIKGYKIPTLVILEDNKLSIKEHYKKDGFTDYILISNIKEEIKKLDKYIK